MSVSKSIYRIAGPMSLGFYTSLLLIAALMSVSTASLAQDTCPAAIQDRSIACNSQNVTIAAVEAADDQILNCVAGQPVTLDLEVNFVANAQSKFYDIGVWFAEDGGDITKPDGAAQCTSKPLSFDLFGDSPNEATQVTTTSPDFDDDQCADTYDKLSNIAFTDDFDNVTVNCDALLGGAPLQAVVGWKTSGNDDNCSAENLADLADFGNAQCSADAGVLDMNVIGALTVVKLTDPSTSDTFGFSSTGGYVPGGLITDQGVLEGDFDLAGNGGSIIMEAFLDGTPITVTEDDLAAGYNLNSISCTVDGTDGTPAQATIDLQNASISVPLSGEQPYVTCTFNNAEQVSERRGTVTVNKIYSPVGETAAVNVYLSCTSGGPVTSPLQAAPGAANAAEFTVVGFEDGATCAATEDVPANYTADVTDCAAVQIDEGENGVDSSCDIINTAIPAKLTVIKTVVNDHGGTEDASKFTMSVTGTNVSNASFPGAEDPGTTVTLDPGAYSVGESGPAGYSASYSDDCTGTANWGDEITCTVTNDDIAPELTVVKTVDNLGTGTAVAGEFTMLVSGTDVSTPSFAGEESPGTKVTLDKGAYSVTENMNQWTGFYSQAASGDCSGTIDLDESKTCTITNTLNSAKWNFTKRYIGDNSGGEVWVTLTCNDSEIERKETSGLTATLTYTGFEAGKASCMVREDVPPGDVPQYVGDCTVPDVEAGKTYSCGVGNATTEVRIMVTKYFTDETEGEVTINVECNDGFISQDGQAMITGGDLAGHTFIITDFVDGELDCTVAESGVSDGYTQIVPATPEYTFTDISSSAGTIFAPFVNLANPAEYTVTKDWTITNTGGNAIDEEVYVTIECNSMIDPPPTVPGAALTPVCLGPSCGPPYYKTGWLGDDDSLTARVYIGSRPVSCRAWEREDQSGVMVENECENATSLSAGQKYGCTIYNTVFFEGIPTLSQWGMAIMALLMLGIGFIGFRRFI